MDKILILDCNAMCHMAKFKVGMLSHEGASTGIIYGFLLKLGSLMEMSPADVLLFVWDSANNKGVRRKLYPEYKASKIVKTEEDKAQDELAYSQFVEIRETVLPAMGFKNIHIADGFEADDLIASAVYGLKDTDTDVMLASSDGDMHQLLNHCRILSLMDRTVLTKKVFIEKWGFGPEYWSIIKAIAGCSGDNVEGIRGVGEITAAKYLKGELKESSKKYKDIKANWKIAERNFELVDLPIDGTPAIEVDFNNYFNVRDFAEVCEAYGLKSFMKDSTLTKWEGLFGKK